VTGSTAQATVGAFSQSAGSVTGAGSFIVDGSFTQSAGGSIATTGTVSITQSSGDLVVGGGVAGRAVALQATAGHVQIDRPVSTTTGTLSVNAGGAGSDAKINAALTSTSGLVDVGAARDLRIDAEVTSGSGMVALDAGRDLIARSSVTAGGPLLATVGRNLRVEDAYLQAGESVIIATGSLDVLASGGPAGIRASSDLGILAGGPVQVRGGSTTGSHAEISNGGGDFILSAGGITLTGGSGNQASAQINGSPDVSLTLTGGSSLALVPGTGVDAYARVNASSPTTVYLDLRGYPPGGFSVAGVGASVYDPASGSGLFANGIPVVRADSLLVFFNGVPEGLVTTAPPIDPASLVLASIAQGGSTGGGGASAGGSGSRTTTGGEVTDASTEEGTTILLLRPRQPALCN